MIRIIVILISLLPLCMNGQYTYFNMSYQPVFPTIGTGNSTSLTVYGDSLMAYSCIPVEGQNARRILVVGPNGEVVRDEWIGIGDHVYVTNYSDTVFPSSEGGFIWSGSKLGGGTWPIVLWMNDQFEIVQTAEFPVFYSDTTYSTFFHSCQALNGDVISSGRVYYETGPMPGDFYFNLALSRIDNSGNEVYYRQYTLEDLDIEIDYAGPQALPRGGIFELSNGDILLFGSIGNPLDCYAIKFDSEGNYLDHVKWGHAQYGDGSPWPVKIGEDEFAVGYSVFAFETNDGYVFTRPRIAMLNASSMELLLGNFFDHPHYYGGVTDMERSPDGGWVMLGYANQNTAEGPGSAFLLKLNWEGDEEWYKLFLPLEEEYHTLTAYDLEMTPDGGMAFVGNYFSYESMNYVTWIVKTDACGELEFNGCGPQVAVTEASTEDDLLLVYPNPTSDQIQVNWKGEALRLEVVNAFGQSVDEIILSPWEKSRILDLRALAAGMYQLRVQTTEGSQHCTVFLRE